MCKDSVEVGKAKRVRSPVAFLILPCSIMVVRLALNQFCVGSTPTEASWTLTINWS